MLRATAASLPAREPEAALLHQAVLLMELGRFGPSRDSADRALARNPGSAAVWYLRSELQRYSRGDPDLVPLAALLDEPAAASRPRGDLSLLHFALGKALLDSGDHDQAFVHLHEGNRLERAAFAYDAQATSEALLGIVRACTPEFLQRHAGNGDPAETPVFIVGMPRSGTTLLEQILASHPAIHGAGELTLLSGLVRRLCGPDLHPLGHPRALAGIAPDGFARLGRRYATELAALGPGSARIVDKMHDNFLYAGLIHLILPNARIIHCRRDPIDTCLSCYTKRFSTRVSYAYDLRELGRFYRGYEAVTAHWREVLPAECYAEVRYEDIVDDLEGEARRLVAFCGLGWDAACLEFHRTERAVRTASAMQVRQPLYRSSVGRWRDVAEHLGPLLETLHPVPGADPLR